MNDKNSHVDRLSGPEPQSNSPSRSSALMIITPAYTASPFSRQLMVITHRRAPKHHKHIGDVGSNHVCAKRDSREHRRKACCSETKKFRGRWSSNATIVRPMISGSIEVVSGKADSAPTRSVDRHKTRTSQSRRSGLKCSHAWNQMLTVSRGSKLPYTAVGSHSQWISWVANGKNVQKANSHASHFFCRRCFHILLSRRRIRSPSCKASRGMHPNASGQVQGRSSCRGPKNKENMTCVFVNWHCWRQPFHAAAGPPCLRGRYRRAAT